MDEGPEARAQTTFGGEKIMVVKLIKALYGHPQAGAFWEQRCDRALRNAGFTPLGDCGEWRSVYYHPKQKTILMVYVDDSTRSGPKHGGGTKLGVDHCSVRKER